MCYLLTVVVPGRVGGIETYFDRRFQFLDFGDSFVGRAYRKVNPSSAVYHVVSGGCSCDFAKKAGRKEMIQLFKEGFERLMVRVSVASVLNHWYHGLCEEEQVEVKREEKVLLDEFLELFPRIEEDVKYVIKNPAFWGRKSGKGDVPVRV